MAGDRRELLWLALLILNDACPPDNRYYLCRQGEDPTAACIECWQRYLLAAVNGELEPPPAADNTI